MEKRAILAIVLSMLVILIWQFFFAPSRKEKPVTGDQQVETQTAQIQEEEKPAPEIPEFEGEKEGQIQDVVVDTPFYRAVFTTDGARLKSWTLNEYMDRVEKTVLFKRKQESPPAPVQMVSVQGVDDLPLETEVSLDGAIQDDPVFDVDATRLFLEPGREGSILFVGKLREGVEIAKRYRFYGDEYRVDLDIEIINRGETPVTSALKVKWSGTVKQGGRYTFAGPSVLAGKTVARLKAKEIRKGQTFSGDVKWIASENNADNEGNYFVSLIAPHYEEGLQAMVQEKQIPQSEGVGFENSVVYPQVELGAGSHEKFSLLFYSGPKRPELLKTLGVEGEKAINFGRWLGPIEKVLLRVLEFTHGLTGNYGVDIVILSILLKVVFYPLSRKSYKAMQNMQKIQPEMKMLQEKHKDDKQRLNQEMMALYKRRKVNPMGGCLPMLAQFPFLIALYKALPLSFNLRHAPFVLWLQDLSAADTFFVDQLTLPILGNTPVGPLPLLMGASMLIQQKLSPTMGDPRQARMMMIMPVMFIFIFLGFPSGLVLYWFVQNILSIAEQYYGRRKGK
jgi:YidC/Oxa1 family membrane protein insertase